MFIQSFLVCLMPSCTAASNVLGRTCELGIDLGFLGLRKNLPIQCQTNLPALWHRCNLTMIQQTFESPLKRIASGWWWHQGNQLIVSIYHLFRESENILKIWTHHLIIWTHHFFIESTDWKCEDHKTYLIQFGPPHTFANFKRLQSPLWSPVAATSWIDQTKSTKNERHIGSQHHSPFLSHAVQTTQTLRQWTVEISWKLEILAAMCTTWLPTAAHRARSVLFRKMAKKKRRCLISSRSRSTNLAEVWEETDHVKKRRDVPHCAAFMIGKTSQYFGFKSICSWPFSDRDEHSHFRGKSTNQLYAATSGVVLCNAQIDDSMPDCCFRMFYLASGGETGQHFSLFCWRGMGWGVGGWGGLLTFLFKWTLPSCYVNKIFSRTS